MRLYIVVSQALSSGLRAAQACHAIVAFGKEHPMISKDWYENSNNVVILQDTDILRTADDLEAAGLHITRFHEPDLDNALTAICAEPAAKKALSKHRLAA